MSNMSEIGEFRSPAKVRILRHVYFKGCRNGLFLLVVSRGRSPQMNPSLSRENTVKGLYIITVPSCCK